MTNVTWATPSVGQITREYYDRVFETERKQSYPTIDAVERECGFAVNKTDLLDAARVLACPVKINPPNWQHGRLIYSTARMYLSRSDLGHVPAFTFLDIGTAKGFSALCMRWALNDANREGHVVSCDVINPSERVPRNTVAEVDKLRTLDEILLPWIFEAKHIKFLHSTGGKWLKEGVSRVHFAFVDGKHNYESVSSDARELTRRQFPGDVTIFDDVHIEGIGRAVYELRDAYELNEVVAIAGKRAYVVAIRKGRR